MTILIPKKKEKNMRRRWKVKKGKSKRVFRKTARPVKFNKRRGLKRGGTRL